MTLELVEALITIKLEIPRNEDGRIPSDDPDSVIRQAVQDEIGYTGAQVEEAYLV